MAEDARNALRCYRCGASLTALSLPWSRLDECPECRAELHVCAMCVHYAAHLAEGCDEDDAPDVRDKRTANFCDYFAPSTRAFEPDDRSAQAAARAELAALFGDKGDAVDPAAGAAERSAEAPSDEELSASERARLEAEALFRK